MSNPCPFCGTPIEEHEAGACLDAWMAKFMPPIQTRVKDAFGNILRLRDKEPLRPYSTSLDAMAEARAEIERRGLEQQYFTALRNIVANDALAGKRQSRDGNWLIADATALQCCRAAIAVLGKESSNVK